MKSAASAVAVALALSVSPVYAQTEDSGTEDPLPKGVIGRAGFAVEDFVPNRVKVEAEAPDRRYGKGDPLRVVVRAEEMFGQPIAGRPVTGSVNWTATPFAPKGWDGFSFGDSERKFESREVPLAEKMLGNDGKTSLTLNPPKARPAASLTAYVQVTVTEGGRGVTRSLKRVVDPVPFYLGIKNQSDTYPKPGEEANFEIVAVSPDGSPAVIDEELTGTISRVRWNSNLVRSGESYSFTTSRELTKVTDTSVTLTGGRAVLPWTPDSVGNYLVQLGSSARGVSVAQTFYVSDSNWNNQPWSMEKPEVAELVLDKKKYVAGETARLLIKAPFPGTVLLTLEQDRVLSSTILTMKENTLEVPITLTEEMLPNVYAVASVIRPVQPAAQWLPHRAVGMVNLLVASESRLLDVKLTTPEEVRPGENLTVTAELHDAVTSTPVSGDIIVWAVDEGVLSLTDFETPAPGKFFQAVRQLMVESADFYSKLMPDLVEKITASSTTGGGDEGDGRLSPVASERVKPVVLWQGPARTDASGKLQIQWTVPQYMGRLRVMAMAADGKRFGNGDSTVFVRNPIMVKEYLPRFAAPGDQFTAGFTVFNNTDTSMTPALRVTADKLVKLNEEESQTLEAIAPRQQVTVYREATVAPSEIGQSNISIAGTAGSESFETSVSLPVRPASPRVSESGSVMVKAGESASIKIPGGDFLPDTTTVTLVAGGRPDIALAGAFNYNVRYPYGCTEQVISGLFPLLYLMDLASYSNPEQYSKEGIRYIVQSGIDRVMTAQTSLGALSMWIGGYQSWDWTSIYGAHFLTEAAKAGYQVNPEYMTHLLDYLQTELSGNDKVSADILTRRAYACYVMARNGRKVQQRMEQLYDVRGRLSTEGRAILAAAYLQGGMEPEARKLLEVKPLADVDVTSVTRESGGILASPIRETALLLMTWVDLDPEASETAALAERLLNLRHQNHWGTTQDNAFSMLALGRYAQATANREPTRGSVRVGGNNYEFTSDEPLRLSRAELAGGTAEVRCESGVAHLSFVAEGVPMNPPAKEVARGVGLQRRYLDREGEPLDPAALKQGQLVIVELSVSGNQSIDNVVVQDLLPAGLEIENARLASAETTEAADENSGFYVNRMDVRDDRMLLFATLGKVNGGVQTYRYTARAVTPGEYLQPPAMLEVMYDPAIQARTEPGRVTVLGR